MQPASFYAEQLERAGAARLTGFAAGVMVAASIWSLLLPANGAGGGHGAVVLCPRRCGFLASASFFLLGLDRLILHLHRGSAEAEGIKSSLGKTTMLTLAVALHNIPEGMAVGRSMPGGSTETAVSRWRGRWLFLWVLPFRTSRGSAIISMPLKAGGFPNPALPVAGRCPAQWSQ